MGEEKKRLTCSLKHTVLGVGWESDTRLQECISSLFGSGIQWLFCIQLYSSMYVQYLGVCGRVLNFACMSGCYRSFDWR